MVLFGSGWWVCARQRRVIIQANTMLSPAVRPINPDSRGLVYKWNVQKTLEGVKRNREQVRPRSVVIADVGSSKCIAHCCIDCSPCITKALAKQNRLVVFDSSMTQCAQLPVEAFGILQGLTLQDIQVCRQRGLTDGGRLFIRENSRL